VKTWVVERWTDPAKFVATSRATLALIGALFAADVIPTGVPGLGPKIAAALNVLAFGMAAGDKSLAGPPAEGN
jgi:hypothetical protein